MTRTMAIPGVLLLVILLLMPAARAQDLSGIPGAYVDIGLGVRPLGMGGAFVAVAEDENAARWNPAALAAQEGMAFGFTWTKQMNVVPYNYVSGSLPIGKVGTGYYFQTNGDDVLRESTGAVGAGIKLARFNLPNVYVGMTAKIRWASFGNNSDGGISVGDPTGQVVGDAFGYGLDLGVLWMVQRVQGLSVGFVVKDVLNSMSWDREITGTDVSGSYSESVPTVMAVGAAYRLGTRTLFAADIEPALYSDVYWRYHLGAEYVLLKVIALRGGYAADIGAGRNNRDYTLGLGIDVQVGGIYVDAGVSYLFDELNNTPRVGIAFRW